jgi:hypothetical protein
MKNLKTFENYNELSPYFGLIKKYGDHYSLTKLSVGDFVTYYGSVYTVEEVNPYSIRLKSLKTGKYVNVNQNMFDEKGSIAKDYKSYEF